MATQAPSPHEKQPHGTPYCSDPNCPYCEELREMQEAIRLHHPIPKKSSQKELQTNGDVFNSVRKLFDSKAERPKQQLCTQCNSVMRHIDGLFWLFGTESKWQISLPFCPTCEPEMCKQSGKAH